MIEVIIIGILTIFTLSMIWYTFKPKGNKEIKIEIKEMKRKLKNEK